MPIDPQYNKKLYHITNAANLTSIILTGLYSGYEVCRRGLCPVNIGHMNLKEKRARHPVPVPPYGTLDNYVPFFFATRPPMIISISKGHVNDYGGTQREIIYLVSSIGKIVDSGSPWCFTEGHAVESMTRFFTDLVHLAEIDWNAVEAWDYRPTNSDPQRMRKKQAEFLVFAHVPWGCIESISVMDRVMLEQVEGVLRTINPPHRPNVNIQRNWYHNPRRHQE
jgi:hypothetical protein